MSESELYTKIGHNIKVLRDYYKITQKQLGDILEVRNTTISNYEKGNPIDIYTLNLIANYFKVPINDILLDNIIEKIVAKIADEYKKYIGLYYVYYFSDQDFETVENTVLELGVNPKGGYTNLIVAGIFNNMDYFGNFSLYNGYYIIEIEEERYKTDSVFIQGLIPPPPFLKDSYNGGITFVLSISKGRSKLPRFQKLIISKIRFDDSQCLKEYLNVQNFSNIIKLEEYDDNKFQEFLNSQK